MQALLFKVAEAESRDVGRAIVRLDPKDFLKVKAEVGDIVEIRNTTEKSQRRALAKLMPAFEFMRGKKVLQMDGILRENASTGLDEKVKIRKVEINPASVLVLEPLTSRSSLKETDSEYLVQILHGVPTVKGSKIRATLFGSKFQDFLVEDTDPQGAVLITQETTIKIRGAAKGKGDAGITYEDIGGLKKEIGKIREMVELPLKYPELFERLGIDAPKGVLIHGPPGCGKTLIARAVANETDAYFTHISGPEIMGKFYGESEGRLREIFEEAEAHAPAVLVIDEIDSIAPKREDMGGEKQVERRVVAQLLALMDGLESRGNVVVIGITNIPNTLDPALRRPGRFDREISIPIPDKHARYKILEVHTRGMPLAENVRPIRNGISNEVNLEKLAEITHGFVGADLEALAREAAMSALRDIMPEIEFSAKGAVPASGGENACIPYEKLLGLQVTMNHFQEALKEVEPSALREVFTEVPDVRWENVGGLENIKQILKEAIEWPLRYEKLFDYSQTNPAKGILLHGPAGTGKTLLAKAAASQCGVNFISVKGSQLLSKWVGESEKGVREVFKKAKQSSPCVLVFDELDSLVPVRSQSSDSRVTERVVGQFLAELDGIEELKGVVIIGTTNRLELIDPALRRAGRFDFLLEVPMPDEKSRLEIFKIHTQGKPISSDVNLKSLSRETKGLTGADIETLCKKASILAIREFVGKSNLPPGDYKKFTPLGTAPERPLGRMSLSGFTIAARHFNEAMKDYRQDAHHL